MKERLAESIAVLFLSTGLILAMPPVIGAEPDSEGWIAFDGSNGHILIEVAVNGVPAGVILDSGADTGAISESFAEKAGVEPDPRRPVQASGIYDQHRVFGSREFELELNDTTIPLSGVPVVPGTGFDLLIGRWIFEQGVVQIDYPNQRLRLLTRDGVEFEGNVPVRRGRRGDLMVETYINGKRAWLQLDTGNGGVTKLTRSFVTRHGLDEFAIERAQITGGGVIRTGRQQLLQIDEAEFGPFRIANFLASYNPDPNRGLDERYQTTGSRIRRPRTHHDGLIGWEVLRNFLVTADFREGKLHLHVP